MHSPDNPQTFFELLRSKSLRHPDRLAYTFLVDGEREEQKLTYGELDHQARAIAARLQASELEGQRVLLLYAPGLDYIAAFLGCLYAGVIAVPAYPPRNNQSLLRLQMIHADAQAAAILSTSLIKTRAELLFDEVPALKILPWITTDTLEGRLAATWMPPEIDGRSLAFLQYTSGSTALPKGVMVSHGNLLHNEQCIRELFQQTEDSIIVGWLPFYHDMGLIGNVLQPLYVGAACVLMSPVAFLQRPFRWLQAISNYRGTTSGGPNFAYELCRSRVTAEQRASLDLSSWRVAFNGAEPIRSETLDRFAATFAECGFSRESFYPCYGLAESTLVVSGKMHSGAPAVKSLKQTNSRSLVSCGASLHNDLIIVDPQTLTESLTGQVGEIWVQGASVAQGYWNRPEETENTFHAYLSDTGAGPFLRTGDLGFLHEGELFITGRIKDLLIIRGQNHYPQDIELTVERCHTALRPGCGAAFSVELEGEERLIVVQEFDSRYKADAHEVISQIRQVISDEHELHAHGVALLKRGTIPKTSSGKIQRHACRIAFLNGTLDTLAEWRSSAHSSVNEHTATDSALSDAKALETWLRAEVAKKLGLDPESLDVTQPLTRFGLDSLMAIELSYAVEQRLGIALPMTSFMQEQSLVQLSLQAAEALGQEPETTVSPETNEHRLSRGQQALWFLHRLAPESSAYNIAAAVRINSELDTVRLRRAFQLLFDRHDSLRTTFPEISGQPVRRVHERAEVPFIEHDATEWDERVLSEHLTEEAHAPFDLQNALPLRVVLFKRATDEHILLVALHHIVADFWSLAVLMQELAEAYTSEASDVRLSLPQASYDDFVRRQEQLLCSSEGERLWSYWQQQLSGELPVLNLHTRQPRPPVQTFRGTSHPFTIETKLLESLKALGHHHGATLFMTLLAAFQTLLHRYTGQTDIIIGSPTAGRGSADLSGVVGYFINPVALRQQLYGDWSFSQLLTRTRATTIAAFAHQEFPFAQLVERLQPQRDPSRSPVFQVMLVLQKSQLLRAEGLTAFALGEAGAQMQLGALQLESVRLEQRIAQFDLTLMLAEVEGELRATLEYNNDLFEADTIRRLAANFQTLLAGIVAGPQRPISEVLVLSAEEQHELLIEFNRTKTVSLPDRYCLHELFEAQVKRTPEAVALAFRERSLTYAELNRRANQLARHLRGKGVGAESLVGILCERTPDMFIGLLGVLKAGGAYVPLDAGYPIERLRLILADADVRVVLTQRHLLSVFEAVITEAGHDAVICLDEDWPHDEADLEHDVDERNLAYVIYTSGSTGLPKGVAITHASAGVMVRWALAEFTRDELACVLASTSINFDLSIFEMFVPLSTGGKVVLASNALELAELGEHEVTLVNTVPSAMAELVRVSGVPASVRVVNLAGEPLTRHLAQQIYQQFPRVKRVVNLYGPSEDTTYSTVAVIERDDAREPSIGRPVANTQVYILNEQLQPVPLGVTGEICIGGDGLARGYLNRAAATAERFIPDPFSKRAGARMYRTGDLARYFTNGEIEFLGRVDHQVKIRGFRIEPGEIAAALDQYAGVRESVVVLRESAGGEKRLVAYVAGDGPEDQLTAKRLRAYLKQRLPEYMLPSALMILEQLPRTPNGKIDRRALPEPEITPAQAEDYAAPRTICEEGIADIWSELLHVKRIGLDDNFFDLGGHSLLATQAISRIRDLFKVEIPLRKFVETPTLRALALEVEARLLSGAQVLLPPIRQVSRDEDLPLSFAQQRLWFLHRLEPDSSFYNMHAAFSLEGQLNIPALERCFNEIIRRHEVLRTTFAEVDGYPVPVVTPALEFRIDVDDLSGMESVEIERRIHAETQRSFSLARGPLLRVRVMRVAEEEHLVVFVVHHIAADGWSMGVIVREVAALYEAYARGDESPLPELPIQYADFAHWQRSWLRDEVLASQLDYWRKELAGAPTVLELPGDRPRPPVQTFHGARFNFSFSVSLNERLKEFSQAEGVTLFMSLLAGLSIVLSRYSGQTDILVGTTIANRNRAETEDLIGFFVNMLVMRTDLAGRPSVRELLRQVRERALEAYAHQDLPFEKLVEELQLDRELSRAPLTQVVFTLQNAPVAEVRLEGLRLSMVEVETETSKFDVVVNMWEERGEMLGWIEYNRDVFDENRIRRMVQHYENVMIEMLDHKDGMVEEIRMLSVAEDAMLEQQIEIAELDMRFSF
jgi:amino acid adenylation domain-containing protein